MMIAQHLAFIFVPRAGIEPAWRLIHWCLRPARLPIPPSGQIPPCLFAVAKVLIIFELTNFLVTFFSKNAFLMQKH